MFLEHVSEHFPLGKTVLIREQKLSIYSVRSFIHSLELFSIQFSTNYVFSSPLLLYFRVSSPFLLSLGRQSAVWPRLTPVQVLQGLICECSHLS